jgi:hypothetical protein
VLVKMLHHLVEFSSNDLPGVSNKLAVEDHVVHHQLSHHNNNNSRKLHHHLLLLLRLHLLQLHQHSK